jgi:hypothetical protein
MTYNGAAPQPFSGPSASGPSASASSGHDRWIVGAAVFDWTGLPIYYFVPLQSVALPWEEVVCEALGLQSLLLKLLRLEGFSSARAISHPIEGVCYSAFVMRRPNHYLALLIDDRESCLDNPDFRDWLDRVDAIQLKNNPRFKTSG